LISTWGTIIYAIATILNDFTLHGVASSALENVGWVLYTTGFAFVLYSRLFLLQPSPRIMKALKVLIIINAILFHTPTIVITTLYNQYPSSRLIRIGFIIAKFEIAFTIQEAMLTTLYIYLFIRFTKDHQGDPRTKYTLWQLVATELFILVIDIIVNALLYMQIYLARQMIQAFAVALKLRVEFMILNSLVKYSQNKAYRESAHDWHGETDFITMPSEHLNSPGPLRMASEQSEGNDIEAGPVHHQTVGENKQPFSLDEESLDEEVAKLGDKLNIM
jgi:hypothetical protein